MNSKTLGLQSKYLQTKEFQMILHFLIFLIKKINRSKQYLKSCHILN